MSHEYGYRFGRCLGKYCMFGYVPMLLSVAVVGLGYLALKNSFNDNKTVPCTPDAPEQKPEGKSKK